MSGYSGNNSFNYWWNTKSLKVPGLAYDYFVMSFGVGNVYALSESLADGVVVRGLVVQRKVSMTGSVTSWSNAVEVKYVPALVSKLLKMWNLSLDGAKREHLVNLMKRPETKHFPKLLPTCVRILQKRPSSIRNFVPMNRRNLVLFHDA